MTSTADTGCCEDWCGLAVEHDGACMRAALYGVPPEVVAAARYLEGVFAGMWREEVTDEEVMPLVRFALDAAASTDSRTPDDDR